MVIRLNSHEGKNKGKKALAYICSFILLILFSSIVSAVQEKQIQAQPDPEPEPEQVANTTVIEKKNTSFLPGQTFSRTTNKTDALSVSLGLIFILVLIFALAWFMKKIGYSNLTGQGQLKIIATLNLGQKEKIALIQVGSQQLLVGVTATQINTLHVLDDALDDINVDESIDKNIDKSMATDNPFANKLSEFIKTRHKQVDVKE